MLFPLLKQDEKFFFYAFIINFPASLFCAWYFYESIGIKNGTKSKQQNGKKTDSNEHKITEKDIHETNDDKKSHVLVSAYTCSMYVCTFIESLSIREKNPMEINERWGKKGKEREGKNKNRCKTDFLL